MMTRVNIAVLIIVWNAIAFAVYGIDKFNARHGRRRISEKALLLSAALMGGFGALLGMCIFRHKTKHFKFVIGVPLLLALNVAVVWGLSMRDTPAVYQKITPEEAKSLIESGKATILDVRTAAEFEEGHIPDAILIPDTEITDRAAELLPDKRRIILVYCRSGVRSVRAAHILIELGYAQVYDLGGILNWPYDTT
jgi:uncharacterized membrane protein YsdA (DUF1294 family)/rhodanese-related sulfurtransferase